jgi:hypothetical protein
MRLRNQRGLLAGFVCALALVLAACSGSGTTSATSPGNTTTTTAGTPSATGTPGATGTPPNTCAGLLPGATAPTPDANFTDITFPSGSVTTGPNLQTSGTGVYFVNLQSFCISNSTVSAVQQFFATQLPMRGWTQADVIPRGGYYFEACGDQYCWMKDTAPRLIGLQNVVAQPGNNVTFDLLLMRPPAEPQCASSFTGAYQLYLPVDVNSSLHFELPVLTKIGGAPTTNGSMTTYQLCSSGDAGSIIHELTDALTRVNWTVTPATAPATGLTAMHNGDTTQVTVTFDATNPQQWQLQVSS